VLWVARLLRVDVLPADVARLIAWRAFVQGYGEGRRREVDPVDSRVTVGEA
jgi:hypothetical protein